MEYKDYYKILGVEKTATKDEIKKAYRQLAKKNHPDKNKGNKASEEKFKEINEAFEVLGNDEKRKKYDQFSQYGDFQSGSNINPEDFASMFGGFSNYRGGQSGAGHSGDFTDFFDALFGGMGGASHTTYRTYSSNGFDTQGFGAQGHAGYDAYGASNSAGCAGSGCGSSCGGHTQQPVVSYDLETAMTISLKEGFEGKVAKISYNAGEGKKSITAKIPAGIENGKKIKLKEQGRKKPNGDHGNLLIKINIDAGEDRLDGIDIYKKIDIFPWEAYMGVSKLIETVDGRIKVKIPAGIKSGQKIKLNNKGYKDMKGNRGKLYIEVVLTNPEELPEEIKNAYEAVSEESKKDETN